MFWKLKYFVIGFIMPAEIISLVNISRSSRADLCIAKLKLKCEA